MKDHIWFPISLTYKLCIYLVSFSSYTALKIYDLWFDLDLLSKVYM